MTCHGIGFGPFTWRLVYSYNDLGRIFEISFIQDRYHSQVHAIIITIDM